MAKSTKNVTELRFMKYLRVQEEKEAMAWIQKAAEVAEKSLCLRAKCGAVIVKDGELIGEGYNGPPLDDLSNRMCLNEYELPQKFKYDRTCCVHAEWRAIFDALKSNSEKINDSTLYFTRINEDVNRWGKPFCTVCSRMILDSGIGWIVLPQEKGLCLYEAREYNKVSYDYTSSDKS